MTATLEAPVTVRAELVLIHEDGREELHGSTYGAAKDARARGRKAVKDDDALDFRVQDAGTFEAAAAEPEVTVPEPVEDSFDTAFVPEDLGYDEMTGTDYPDVEPAAKVDLVKPKGRKAAAPRPKAVAGRKERVFLEASEYITYDLDGTDVQVRVITATRADTGQKLLQPTDEVAIFGHRRGLIATRKLAEVPGAVAAYVKRELMASPEA